MPQATIPYDLVVQGTGSFKQINLPAGSVTPAALAAGAPGNYFPVSGMRQKFRRLFATASAATAATAQQPLHVVVGATATAIGFEAGLITACTGNATVTVDLKINGTSILSAPVVLSDTSTARVPVSAGILTAALTSGQIVEIVVTVSAGTGTIGQGLFAVFTIDEDPA